MLSNIVYFLTPSAHGGHQLGYMRSFIYLPEVFKELVVIGRAFGNANIYAVACLPIGASGIKRERPSALASWVSIPVGLQMASQGFYPKSLAIGHLRFHAY